jgi:hypothetical protein
MILPGFVRNSDQMIQQLPELAWSGNRAFTRNTRPQHVGAEKLAINGSRRASYFVTGRL